MSQTGKDGQKRVGKFEGGDQRRGERLLEKENRELIQGTKELAGQQKAGIKTVREGEWTKREAMGHLCQVVGFPLLMLVWLELDLFSTVSGASDQNFCSNTTVLRTRTPCHSCNITPLIPCPFGFRKSPGTTEQDCEYNIKTASLNLAFNGCSFECYKNVEDKQCCPGYWGLDCIECPEYASSPCNNNGVCSDGMDGNGTCSCKERFVGTACEDCAANRYGPTCGSVCTCVHGLCSSGLLGDGMCTCFSAYTGPNCDQELSQCAALKCPANSRCMEDAHTGLLTCKCMPGYQTSGKECISINPCLQQVCHIHATCVHSGPNQHVCACAEGYSGDGYVCMPIDPCQTNQGGCSTRSTRCVYDSPGKSHCECLPGFEHLEGGLSCSLRDVCKLDSCHKDANCTTVEPGTVECTCRQGFLGNGKVCFGNIMLRLQDLNTEPGGKWAGQLTNAITLFATLSWPLQNAGPFTVFVPTNKGCPRSLVKMLMADSSTAKFISKLHVVAGEVSFNTLKKGGTFYTLNGIAGETETTEDSKTKIRIYGTSTKSTIMESDVFASNGMIHVINKLMNNNLSPPVASDLQINLLRILNLYGKFTTFATLLEKVNLASVLDMPGPYTVFAPTDIAFDSMKEGYLQYLNSPEGSSKLVELLRNHIVTPATLDVYNVVSNPRVVTMANQVLLFNVTKQGQILVNGKAVLVADVEAKNGRLYSLDGVLIPSSIEPVLPHRCDITETKLVEGECISCSRVHNPKCPSGFPTGPSIYGCIFNLKITSSPLTLPVKGCSTFCNTTVTTLQCCKGFYGPECSPCPGGFQTPCSGHGQCMEGISGNGTCVCEANFQGSRCQYCADPNKYGPNCDKTCECIHGQCDNRPGGVGRCKSDTCRIGYIGPYCERQTKACGYQVQFCHAHAECVISSVGQKKCACKPGYQGDGITCVEKDPCAPPHRGGCSINAKCIKAGPSTHTCQCLTGWKEDGDDCQPINKCDSPDKGGCHPNATCIYVGPGQSDCMCKAGYQGNGRQCEAANRCVNQNGGCHNLASCHLVVGQWKCVCMEGYEGNGEVCYGNVEQELMGLPEATGFIKWVTNSGLSQSLSRQNITLLVPTSAAINAMSKDDRDFWTTTGNLPSIVRNHMIPGNYPLSTLSNSSFSGQLTSLLKTILPVSATNETTAIGGATFTTANIAAINGLIHVINKVLIPDRKQSEGLLELLALRPEFSLFRTCLIEHNLTEEIEADEYTVFAPTDSAVNDYLKKMAAVTMDINTTRYHIVPSERLLKTDLQAGGYKKTLLGFSYQLGFFPRDGKLFINEAQLNVSNIMTGKGVIHSLSSVLEIKRNRCDTAQYQTVMGTCQNCFLPQRKVCPSGTISKKSVQRRRCMFTQVYEGEQLHTIGCRSTCAKMTIVRKCCSGFFGEHCEQCPGLKGQPCFSNGICIDGTSGTGVCQCNQGFTGTACETCQAGKYSIHCDQECACKNGQCQDGLKGDGTCECALGWKGVLCDEKIESKADELCGSTKCHTSANCVIKPSGTQCICASGFEGNGTYCKAKDPCAVDNGGCSLYGVCKRTQPGRRECVCSSGYSGDGLVCVEINPCLERNGDCQVNADCIHTGPNKKNGGCHRYARCNTTGPGERSCKCFNGYKGDGINCKGPVAKELFYRKLKDFYLGLMITEISLQGRGPFTVFAPTTEAFLKEQNGKNRIKPLMASKHKEMYANVLRNHIVMCHTLLASDLTTARNLTTVAGEVLTTKFSEGSLFINQANVTYTDDVSTNGIIHEIDTILFPSTLGKEMEANVQINLTDVAAWHGYKTFIKLLEDTGVMDLLNGKLYHPFTIFLPSDRALASLPQEQKDFLYNQQNRAQLLEYVKYHILHSQKVYATELAHLVSARTLQGSQLSFGCGGLDKIGEIFINGGTCRIIKRHLLFKEGIAYGIDCLLTPPSLGGRCDEQKNFELQMNCGPCTSSSTRCPGGSIVKEVQQCDLPMVFVSKNTGCRTMCTVNFWQSKCCAGYYGRDCLACPGGMGNVCSLHGLCDDGHLGNGTCTCDTGFQGMACEMCSQGHYGPTCKACNCTEQGSCEEGLKGTGSCFCEQGWTGQRCEIQQDVPVCSPACSPKGVCKENNTCVCRPFYEGDGFTCTVADLCSTWNSGCAKDAKCIQKGEKVSCLCPKGHTGDGFSCQPIDPCADEGNGGCHEHATCTMTGPGKKRCDCKDKYIGDGVSCEVKDLPINRCLQDNQLCHQDAQCTDLHFEDATVGVFHFRSNKGQYKLNYTAAQEACVQEGGSLASYTQLSYAQQAGLNMCAASWLDSARVAYPTTFSNPNCGFGHVGIVDYGIRKNLSETWDAFCFRVKEVKCECKHGYIGDGYTCTGNLLQVLSSRPFFSNFLTQILNYSLVSVSGKEFVKRLSNLTVQSTLFVPDNIGLPENQTLSQRDIEYHLSEGQALALRDLKNGSRIRTRQGSLTVFGIVDFLNPTTLSSCYINDRFVTDSDVQASNGIIHVIRGPLIAPPPQHVLHAGHKAGMGIGVVVLVMLVAGVIFVGYHFYSHQAKPFQFHYFKEEEEESSKPDCNPSICNPVYDASADPVEPTPSDHSTEDKHEVVNGGSYDLLQNS
ncbi:stabilin-2 isoform X2 [Lampris incognitus]|uniref:stabilin-2 isoform X2 n=1 Tax=Lampris incognitus TaxID=2546036 RepID=UPI0024B62C8E|nr:stabilin-2 isoform X2 [Lampris incognitus]